MPDTNVTLGGLSAAKRAWLSQALGVSLPEGPAEGATPKALAVGDPIGADCVVVRGKVPGPVEHVLCGTHGHILDTKAGKIIAADLAEYKKAHPVHHHAAHSGHGGAKPATPQPAPGPAPAAAPDMPTGEMPKQKPIPIPSLADGGKAALVGEMAVLDTLREAKGDPDHYVVMLNGQETRVDRKGADQVREQARKKLSAAIGYVRGTCENAESTYAEQEKNNKDQWAVAAVVSAVQKVRTLGEYKDPGPAVKKLVGEARQELSAAESALGANKFGAAAEGIADAEGKALQALAMVRAWIDGAISGAGASVTVLTHTKTASFAVVSALAAVGTGGAAGVVAAAVLPTAADVAGNAIAGNEINWSGAVIEVGMNLLVAKFGGQAEKAVAGSIEKYLAGKLAGKLAEATAKTVATKAAEAAAKQIIGKGSDTLKAVFKTVAERLKGKKMTWEEMIHAVIAELTSPEAKESAKIQSLAEKVLKEVMPKT